MFTVLNVARRGEGFAGAPSADDGGGLHVRVDGAGAGVCARPGRRVEGDRSARGDAAGADPEGVPAPDGVEMLEEPPPFPSEQPTTPVRQAAVRSAANQARRACGGNSVAPGMFSGAGPALFR